MRKYRLLLFPLLALALPMAPVLYADSPAPTSDVYAQAVSLFNAKDYVSASPLFSQVIQSDPSNYMAYYYLGTCLGNSGDIKSQALDYYLSDRLRSYPALKTYADKLKDGLRLEDQEWLESQLNQAQATTTTAPETLQAPTDVSTPPPTIHDHIPESPAPAPVQAPMPGLPTTSPVQALTPAANAGFGIRLSTSLSFFTLADFDTELGTVNQNVQGWQAANPSDNYVFQSSLPSMGMGVEINPFFPIGTNGEFGFSFTYWPGNVVSYDITDIHPGYFNHAKWDLSSFNLDLKARYYFGQPADKGIAFFLEPALGIQPVYIHFTFDTQNTSATPPSNQVGYDVSGIAFNGALKLGAALAPAPHALISLTAGWQLAAVSGFQGTYSDAGVPSMNGVSGSVLMYNSPTTGQSYLYFMPNDTGQYANFGVNSNDLNYSRSLNVDFGGFLLNADISYCF